MSIRDIVQGADTKASRAFEASVCPDYLLDHRGALSRLRIIFEVVVVLFTIEYVLRIGTSP